MLVLPSSDFAKSKLFVDCAHNHASPDIREFASVYSAGISIRVVLDGICIYPKLNSVICVRVRSDLHATFELYTCI